MTIVRVMLIMGHRSGLVAIMVVTMGIHRRMRALVAVTRLCGTLILMSMSFSIDHVLADSMRRRGVVTMPMPMPMPMSVIVMALIYCRMRRGGVVVARSMVVHLRVRGGGILPMHTICGRGMVIMTVVVVVAVVVVRLVLVAHLDSVPQPLFRGHCGEIGIT